MAMILIGGWAASSALMAPLRMALGVSPETAFCLDRPLNPLRAQLEASLTPGSILVGWSLGGMLALELAARRPDHVGAVVTIASNARFLATDSWPHAYPASVFEQFQQALEQDPKATLKRFAGLQTQGSPAMREDLRWLQEDLECSPPIRSAVLQETLSELAQLDLRTSLQTLDLPVLHLLGANDRLVPAQVARELTQLNPRHQAQTIPDMAHFPCHRHLSPVAEAIREFVLPIMRSWC